MQTTGREAPFVLLPSPFLGADSWEPVAEELRAAGHEALVVSTLMSDGVRDPGEVLRAFVEGTPPDSDVVLVPHSNAGLYVASVSEVRKVAGVVFVDAGIPVDHGRQPLAPAILVDELAPMADADGMLPGWSQWFDPSVVERLFPDAATRETIERCQPAVAVTYLRSALDVRAGWRSVPSAYLAFGNTYESELERAKQLGWPTLEMAGDHLHMLIDPSGVASEVVRLAERIQPCLR